MASIDICLCTFRRPHIATTLASFAMLELPEGTTFRVIVADNDDTPSARDTVTTAAQFHGLDYLYLHAPARNISIARNACLDAATADYVAFIDDDEVASPGWLKHLLKKTQESGAAIILGHARAVYLDGTPNWVREGDFHSTTPERRNGNIITGYTTNALMRRDAVGTLRFREQFGITGGEDTDFFGRAYDNGAKIDYAPDAVTFEEVPLKRAALRWLIPRRYRCGKTHALALLKAGHPRAKLVVLAIAKLVFCWLMVLPNLLHAYKKQYWFLRGILHLGVLHELLTRKVERSL